jgi:hypothetical protein
MALTTVVLGTLSSLSFTSTLTDKLLSNSIQSSFKIMKKFVSYHHSQINEMISDSDLISKLEIIQALMHDMEKKYENQQISEKESFQKSLLNLHQIVDQIEKVLQKIDDKVKYHQTKYFHGWRTLNYEKEMKQLEKMIKLLDVRYKMFLEILKVI